MLSVPKREKVRLKIGVDQKLHRNFVGVLETRYLFVNFYLFVVVVCLIEKAKLLTNRRTYDTSYQLSLEVNIKHYFFTKADF